MQEVMLSSIYDIPDGQMGTMSLLGINKALITNDRFVVIMEVKYVHLNTQGIVHGGILFTLCDQSVGAYLVYKKIKGMGMDGSIHYYRPANKGEVLTATAYERRSGKKTGVYFVELKNQNDKLIADCLFTAMCLN